MASDTDRQDGASPRILLVRPSALGDVARTVPALVTLRDAYPHARIDWLVQEGLGEVVAHHPALDAVIPFPRQRFRGLLHRPTTWSEAIGWARQLRGRGYDRVFDLQGLFRSGFITRLSGAAERIGFADAREMGWLGYTRRYRVEADHAVDRMLGLLAAHGLTPQHDLRLYVGDADRQWLAGFLHEQGIAAGGRWAVVAPTARWRCKCWPADRFGEVMHRMLAHALVDRVFVVAGPAEREPLTPLLQRFAGDSRVVFPETTIGRMMALLSECSILLCNDSAPLHIAVGFDRPLVALFGPTDPAKVGPYRRDESVIQPSDIQPHEMADYRSRSDDQSIIARIEVETVWNRLRTIMGE